MLVDLFFIVAALVVLTAIAIYKLKFSKENTSKEIEEATKKQQEKEIRRHHERQPKLEVNEKQANNDMRQQGSGWQNQQEQSGSDGEEELVDIKKQLRKEQKQKQKQQRKEAHQCFLEQQKEKREKYQKQSEQRERLEEERRKKEEEVIDQLRQQQRKRKEEEFNTWKDMFKVEQSGKEKLSEEEEKRKIEAFNKQFIGLLKIKKLLLLEDMSHKFKLSTKELVDRIKQLEAEGLISGIFDERGKYLVIDDGQWSAIKNYISAKGRVKKTDIMNECANLIRIPDEVEQDLWDLIKEEPNQ